MRWKVYSVSVIEYEISTKIKNDAIRPWIRIPRVRV